MVACPENPFYPLQEGRETLTATTSFRCSGEAPFDVAWAPGTGTSFGATTCGGGTGSSNIPIGRSLPECTVTVTVDEGVDWTLDVLLAPPKRA
ncbi:hypothetical protein ACFJGV_14845 [Cnuibacter sp. UC19_7]|uniref:hypothetical protein n=1 Tax=Cnuibacter sp. UC19_7 TaxID=3350166 RepID=UPI00366BDE8B